MTAHQCMRMLIMLPEKKSDSPASIALGRLALNALIPTVVEHLLSYAKLSGIEPSRTDESLTLLEEDIKTLTALVSSATSDADSKWNNVDHQ